MTLWRFHCQEAVWPGLWHQWYRHQCVAVGWPPKKHSLERERGHGAVTVRNALSAIQIGDYVVATLKDHRVGRIGQVTAKRVEDEEWDPLVPKSKEWPEGQQGRRVDVRWELTCGPQDRALVVLLPEGSRFNIGELQGTIRRIRSQSVDRLRKAMGDPSNWVSLLAHFDYERALSGYIAAYPHHLEDGLVPYPYAKIREKVFPDGKRLDVLLLDQKEQAVVVECKQYAPDIADLKQLRHYMKWVRKQTGNDVRGILVHGGSRNLSPAIVKAAGKSPRVKIVQHSLKVEFASCFG